MSTLSDLKLSLEKGWDSLSEGWKHLFHKAAGALTCFHDHHDKNDPVAVKRIGWGLLSADMVDNKGEIILTMEVPGLEPDDFDIELHGELLTISGVKHYQDERQEGSYHIMECAYGQFKRSFHLPANVDPNSIEANYKNGVLRLSMTKETHGNKIEVKVS